MWVLRGECLLEQGDVRARSGDAVLWIDPSNPHLGLKFDGRIAEDFKLATGTFVSVGPLRAKIIAAGAPYVQDAVVTGLNRMGAFLPGSNILKKKGDTGHRKSAKERAEDRKKKRKQERKNKKR